jgi:hypothetical protein
MANTPNHNVGRDLGVFWAVLALAAGGVACDAFGAQQANKTCTTPAAVSVPYPEGHTTILAQALAPRDYLGEYWIIAGRNRGDWQYTQVDPRSTNAGVAFIPGANEDGTQFSVGLKLPYSGPRPDACDKPPLAAFNATSLTLAQLALYRPAWP